MIGHGVTGNETIGYEEDADKSGNFGIMYFDGNSSNITDGRNETAAKLMDPKRQAIGVALAISGNVMISLALSVQKYAHNRLGDNGKYYLDKYWWLGMVMMGIGEFGNFMAYGFAAASLVAPLGSVAVLSNVLIAFIFLKERVTPHSVVGVTLVIIGSIFLVSFASVVDTKLNAATLYVLLQAWTFLLYIGIEIVALGILLYLLYGKGFEHMVILLLVVAVIASVTVIAAKAVSSLFSEAFSNGIDAILHPVFWIMLFLLPITTAVQIRFLNRAMQLYNVSDVVPINFIFFTVSAILAGTVFYQEFRGVPFLRVFMFLFGCTLSFIGVYIISHKSKSFGKCTCLKAGDDMEPLVDDKLNNSKLSEQPGTSAEDNERTLISRLPPYRKDGERATDAQPRSD